MERKNNKTSPTDPSGETGFLTPDGKHKRKKKTGRTYDIQIPSILTWEIVQKNANEVLPENQPQKPPGTKGKVQGRYWWEDKD